MQQDNPAPVRHGRDVQALSEQGVACAEQGLWAEAITCFEQAAAADPQQAAVLGNLARAYGQGGRSGDALRTLRRAVALQPASPALHGSLADLLLALGAFDEALACRVRQLELAPHDAAAHSDLLLVMHYHQGVPPQQLAIAHRRYAELVEAPWRKLQGRTGRDADPERPLRLGFVSSDLRQHPVASFAEPLFEHLDQQQFALHAYCNFASSDATSQRLQRHCLQWTPVLPLDDAALAQRIADDGIDILVDLNGHTGGNRLPLFARRPAPVQLSWLGYPNTTGLQAMDHRLVDALTDPPGFSESLCTEQLQRLPGCFVCYRPPAEAPPVSAMPFDSSGSITFGSMNNLHKMSPLVASLWARILDAVPGSSLVLKLRGLRDPFLEDAVLQRLEAQGLPRGRVRLLHRADGMAAHLARYAQIDIALDSFPYAGTTTTCDALWMGVPVLTLAGNTHASRVGASLLHTVGLPELVCQDIAQYVQRAVALAGDTDRLRALRQSLRPRMAASPLTDGASFARHFEDTLRTLWRQRCARAAAGPGDP